MAWFFSSRIYWTSLDHDLMASIWEKAISILAESLNSGVIYLITTVHKIEILFQKGSNPISFLRQAA